jgi:hypothetical protein
MRTGRPPDVLLSLMPTGVEPSSISSTSNREAGRVRANVTAPIPLAGRGLAFGPHFKGFPFGIDLGDELFEAVRSGRRGPIFDISGGDGNQRAEVTID